MSFSADEAFDLLRRAYDGNRLGHAYLVTGVTGSGKQRLAENLFRLVNRLPPGAKDILEHHPDAHVAKPESKSRRIVTEQIRAMEHALHMKPSVGLRKMGVIFEADRLQPQAANAFLKTLEEPPENSLLLLLTDTPGMLLETILSRCLTVPLKAPSAVACTVWETELLQALSQFFARPGPRELPEIFGLVRDFQDILGRCKAAFSDENKSDWKADEKHYKQTTDGKWLAQREEQLEAQGEARYQRQRSALIELLIAWWADVARHQATAGAVRLDLPHYASQTAWLAQGEDPVTTLERLDALEDLKTHLSQNINEPLALEVSFLKSFR